MTNSEHLSDTPLLLVLRGDRFSDSASLESVKDYLIRHLNHELGIRLRPNDLLLAFEEGEPSPVTRPLHLSRPVVLEGVGAANRVGHDFDDDDMMGSKDIEVREFHGKDARSFGPTDVGPLERTAERR